MTRIVIALTFVCAMVSTNVKAEGLVRLDSHRVIFVSQQESTQPSPSDVVTPEPAENAEVRKDGCDCKSACGKCCLGEPLELFPETCSGVKVGGWFQQGYHSDPNGLFNNHPDAFRLHQGWLYAEKKAQGECGWDWGFRTDVVYGVDGADTQAFGNDPGKWDYLNGFDHGSYSWALPQAYVELAKDDLSIIVGHFYTLIGYEVVTAPDNFFYSHAFTMYNSEPFTHTGVLATYGVNDNVEVYGGWTLGWDTGFDRLDANQGNNFLGGISLSVTDKATLTYILTAGNLGWRGDGYSHSIVLDVQLTDQLNYVIQSDLVATDGLGGTVPNDDVGVNQYLLYHLNDCWAIGGRCEWWEQNGVSAYELTGGVNWKPHANIVVRPEIRYQWGDGVAANLTDINGNALDDDTIFGIDTIISF